MKIRGSVQLHFLLSDDLDAQLQSPEWRQEYWSRVEGESALRGQWDNVPETRVV